MQAKFAKLFETDIGQIVVLNHQDSDGNPALVFMFMSDLEGLGVCQVAIGFDDSEEGEAKRDTAFDALTEEMARSIVSKQLGGIAGLFGGGK